jgi:predicted oxidoreductase (fatty acid repression mutant protein)
VDTFLDIVKGRRSIRRFTAQPVEQEKLDVLLEAARWTPSWANTQCWEVIVVADADTKERDVWSACHQKIRPPWPAPMRRWCWPCAGRLE